MENGKWKMKRQIIRFPPLFIIHYSFLIIYPSFRGWKNKNRYNQTR
jgi:hypothetical protein